jgi:hypothetical protein
MHEKFKRLRLSRAMKAYTYLSDKGYPRSAIMKAITRKYEVTLEDLTKAYHRCVEDLRL